jgi:hypothetical protein
MKMLESKMWPHVFPITRTTHAIVANAFMRLYRENALKQPKSGDGLLNIDAEKEKDPWKPKGGQGGKP